MYKRQVIKEQTIQVVNNIIYNNASEDLKIGTVANANIKYVYVANNIIQPTIRANSVNYYNMVGFNGAASSIENNYDVTSVTDLFTSANYITDALEITEGGLADETGLLWSDFLSEELLVVLPDDKITGETWNTGSANNIGAK